MAKTQGIVYTNRMAMAAFNRKRGVPKDGAQLILPDIGQVHTVVGKMFWKYRVRKPFVNASIIYQSRCAACGEEYTYNVPFHAPRLVRTCPDHRGKWRSPQYAREKAHPKPFRNKVAALLLATLKHAKKSAHKDIVISLSQPLTKPNDPRPDAVRYNVRRALQSMIDDKALPPHVRVTATHFIWED